MSDEYLWNRSGSAGADELELERLLVCVRRKLEARQPRAAAIVDAAATGPRPAARRGPPIAVWAVAATVAVTAAAILAVVLSADPAARNVPIDASATAPPGSTIVAASPQTDAMDRPSAWAGATEPDGAPSPDADPALRPTLPAGEARTDVGPQDVASETRRQDGGDGPAQARENARPAEPDRSVETDDATPSSPPALDLILRPGTGWDPCIRPADPEDLRVQPTGEVERISLRAGESASTSSGLHITFLGTTHDDYEDGSFDVLARFVFRLGGMRTEWMPSLRPTSYDMLSFRTLLGHCLRVVQAPSDVDGIALEVFPVPRHVD